jgi:lysophospholipase L1-like esterase
MPKMLRCFMSISALLVCALTGVRAAELPVKVAPNDPNITLIGRFDFRDDGGPRFAWSGSSIRIKFTGTAANVLFKESGADFIQAIVDGKPAKVLELNPKQTVYDAASGLADGEHTLELFKRNEAFGNVTQFQGFQLEAGKKLLAPPPAASRRIEVIGDSITCGYGNEGANEKEHFKPATENNYLAYGPVAARALNADCVEIAWSGKKLAPDNSICDVYDFTLPTDNTSKWDFTKYVPDAVIINLGTNDVGGGNPDEKMWTGAYVKFIERIRSHYPKAHIFCAVGSMLNDSWPKDQKALTTVKNYIHSVIDTLEKKGDKNVHFLEFTPQDGNADGLGSDYHPNVKTHQKMADKLVEALKKELNW